MGAIYYNELKWRSNYFFQNNDTKSKTFQSYLLGLIALFRYIRNEYYNNALTNNQKTIEILIFDTKSMKYGMLFKVKNTALLKQ